MPSIVSEKPGMENLSLFPFEGPIRQVFWPRL